MRRNPLSPPLSPGIAKKKTGSKTLSVADLYVSVLIFPASLSLSAKAICQSVFASATFLCAQFIINSPPSQSQFILLCRRSKCPENKERNVRLGLRDFARWRRLTKGDTNTSTHAHIAFVFFGSFTFVSTSGFVRLLFFSFLLLATSLSFSLRVQSLLIVHSLRFVAANALFSDYGGCN